MYVEDLTQVGKYSFKIGHIAKGHAVIVRSQLSYDGFRRK